MSEQAFAAEEIVNLLTELGGDLDARGIQAELFVVGGAAMALAYNSRRATRYIDAVFEPKQAVYEAADRIALRHSLPDDWLNDAVKGFIPGGDPHQRAVFAAPGINVSVPSPEHLLALKPHATRIDRDQDDIMTLARLCGVSSASEVLTIAERIMGPNRIQPITQFMVQELFPDSTWRSKPRPSD